VADVAAGRWRALATWIVDTLRQDIAWLFTWSPGGKWVSSLVACAFGLLIAVWNLALITRMRLKYRGRALSLNFAEYVRKDPTRADEAPV
jgi:hypothetical protein